MCSRIVAALPINEKNLKSEIETDRTGRFCYNVISINEKNLKSEIETSLVRAVPA